MTMQLAPSTGIISLPLNTNFPNSNSSSNSPSLNNGLSFQNQPTLSSLISQCTHIKHLHQIHAQMLRSGIFFDPYSASKLFTTCALPPFSNIRYAHQIFDQIPQPNLYTWNILIRAYASSSDPVQSLVVFLQMLYHCQDFPNKFTFPFVFKAASELKASQTGKACHGMVIKSSLGSDLFILNSLIHFYSSCGDMDLAYRVFAKILNKDVVSWNSIINASARGDFPMDAFELFMEMEKSKLKPNGVTMVGLLSASAKKLDLEYGRWVCSYIKTNDIYMDLTLSNSMLDMYTKCGSVEDAEILFNEMPEKDIVSWTTMLDGYAKMGKYNEAKRIFNTMPKQDIAAWNVLISSYEQSRKPKEALATFHELQVSKIAKPDEVTLVSTLSACAQLGAIDLGGWIHVYIRKHGIQLNCHLITSLIDMYAKCGDLDKALEVFYLAEKKDVFVWSSMIAGLGMHGRGKDAIDLFLQMQKAKVKPNAVTFTNVLCACSHAGLVNEARRFFYEMGPVHGIEPGSKHYACMVDVLGRAGFLKDAEEFIEKMPISPSASVWGALLGACRLHMNVELAEKASTHLLELEPRNHGAIVLLSNIYAKTGQWDKVSELRKLMRDSELKKEPGCSSIEVNGIVHEFLVSDNSHPRCREVYLKLDEIAGRLKLVGYKPNKSQVLQLVEEEDMKEHALNLHSEKLAIAFGLISIDRGQPIRVVKNLRVCGDCHEVAKLISSLYDREILIRDRYRFHHFRGGQCSCTDYW